jgi:transcription elongation factor
MEDYFELIISKSLSEEFFIFSRLNSYLKDSAVFVKTESKSRFLRSQKQMYKLKQKMNILKINLNIIKLPPIKIINKIMEKIKKNR